MSILSRLAVVALVAVGVLSALVSGQTVPNTATCIVGVSPTCAVLTMVVSSSAGGSATGSIALGLSYDQAGDVCAVGGTIISGSTTYTIQGLSTTGGATNKVRVGLGVSQGAVVEQVQTINIAFTVTPQFATSPVTTGTLVGTIPQGGATLTLSPIFASPQITAPATSDSCQGGAAGDPLFSGFLGQQFYVEGKDGQVFNMLSTFNMQLNGRFVQLEEGAAMYPYQQEKIQMESVIAHQTQPEVAAFPKTTAWNHPGTYFGEVGVALLGDNRVHAKAGSYSNGFAKVTLNGRSLPVSDDFIVLGSGSNTTFVQRVSAHELLVRTVNVEFTIVNSDNFLNVEHLHMERGSKKFSHFGGMLGGTSKLGWSFNKEDEKEAVVESDNLFEREAIEA